MSESDLEKARDILKDLPEEISTEELLYEIHRRSKLDDAIDYGRRTQEYDEPRERTLREKAGEAIGCLCIPLMICGIFFAMPLMFRLSESVFPSGSHVVAEGVIRQIRLDGEGASDELDGRNCKVLSHYVEIETGDTTSLIPRSEISRLVIRREE